MCTRGWLMWIVLVLCWTGCGNRAASQLAAMHRPLDAASFGASAAEGEVAAVTLYLEAGLPADSRDAYQRTPLQRAAWGEQTAVAALLLAHGAAVDAVDVQGRTALDVAVSKAGPAMVAWLIDHGADVNHRDRFGVTPLHRAAWSGNLEVAKRLLEAGARPTVMDPEGRTALHVAALWGSVPLLTMLLAHGADVAAAQPGGPTALHLAMLHPHKAAVRMLLAHGAPVTIRDEYGGTPLHRAVFNGRPDMVEALLAAGAAVDVRDAMGRTPLHRIDAPTTPEVVAMLLARGASPRAIDGRGRTPIDAARDSDNTAVLRLLTAAKGEAGTPGEATGAIAGTLPPPLPPPAAVAREARVAAFRTRLVALLANGVLPIIDVEFHLNEVTAIEGIVEDMDANHVALTWLGADPAMGSTISLHAAAVDDRFVPTIVDGQEWPWMRGDEAFLGAIEQAAASGQYFAMGEFETRRYATNFTDREVFLAIDSPQMTRIFSISSKYRLPFLLHMEAEDRLLPALEAMLTRYPDAPVIWCHGGRIRNTTLGAKLAHPAFLGELLGRHPNLYFDLMKPVEGHEGLADRRGMLEPRGDALVLAEPWRQLMERFPDRFLIGTDTNQARRYQYAAVVKNFRDGVLARLTPQTARALAFGNAWRLMTGAAWTDP